jgi:hypothetical protein
MKTKTIKTYLKRTIKMKMMMASHSSNVPRFTQGKRIRVHSWWWWKKSTKTRETIAWTKV